MAPGQTDVSILAQASVTGWPDPATINVTVGGLPNGVTANWTQLHPYIPPISGVSGALTFSAAPSTAIGQQDALITATSGSLSYTQPLTLMITGVCKPVTECYPGQCDNPPNGCSGTLQCGGCPERQGHMSIAARITLAKVATLARRALIAAAMACALNLSASEPRGR